MTLLFSTMTLLYHLFFCKCQDYYFSLFHYLQKDYYITYDTSIISLIFICIYYCYYCYYHTIICIIFSQTIIAIIYFEDYYVTYCFRQLLLLLWLLSHYYLHYFIWHYYYYYRFQELLFFIICFQNIISIIAIVSIKIIVIIAIIDIIAIIYCWSHLHTKSGIWLQILGLTAGMHSYTSEASIAAKILRIPVGRCTSVLADTRLKQAFSTVFDPPQQHDRDTTVPHLRPND
jgi:hypothetical protein